MCRGLGGDAAAGPAPDRTVLQSLPTVPEASAPVLAAERGQAPRQQSGQPLMFHLLLTCMNLAAHCTRMPCWLHQNRTWMLSGSCGIPCCNADHSGSRCWHAAFNHDGHLMQVRTPLSKPGHCHPLTSSQEAATHCSSRTW